MHNDWSNNKLSAAYKAKTHGVGGLVQATDTTVKHTEYEVLIY